MSNFVIDLRDEPATSAGDVVRLGNRRRAALITAGSVLFLALVCLVAGYFYWQSLKSTPQYSLALIVDASRRNDQKTTNDLVDIDAVVDDFVPQITAKAIEMYGRGMPPDMIQKIANVAKPLMPALKDRVRSELPKVIRERTEKFQNIPFFAMVLGASRYLDIKIDGENASITSKLPDRPFEMKMERAGDRWKISGVKDEQLATMIAQKVGQEIVAFASKGGLNSSGLGIQNLADILRQAEHVFDEQ
ncbi:MAG: hypothetical protein ABI999_03120 [Acidobacteriota bacterium]